MRHKLTRMWTPPAVAIALLLAMFVTKALIAVTPEDAEPYHARVRAAVSAVPQRIGNWTGQDQEVPPSAVALLKPNIILSRSYVNLDTHERVSLLIVHCKDARDLQGHYPPVCYVGQGWTMLHTHSRDWNVGGKLITGMEYRMSTGSFDHIAEIVVCNFMLLPDGKVGRDMTEVQNTAKDYRMRLFGAAQVQLIVDAGISAEDREAIFQTIIAANLDVISAVCSGRQQ
jgi:EpsI family protein